MLARDVIHYSRSPALTNVMHRQVPATIPKLLWLTLLSICIHPNGWDHYLLLTKGRDSVNCTWIMHVDTHIVCCDRYSFFSLKYQPRRERVNLRLKYAWFSGYPTDTPPLPFKHFKGFPSSAICPSRVRHGGHFYLSIYNSMRVFFSWTQLGPEHEINLRGAPYELGTYDRCDQGRLRRACVCTISSGSRSLTKFKMDADSSQIKILDVRWLSSAVF